MLQVSLSLAQQARDPTLTPPRIPNLGSLQRTPVKGPSTAHPCARGGGLEKDTLEEGPGDPQLLGQA